MYHHLGTQPHTLSGPSPVFVVCGCLDEAEGGRPAVRPLHMFPIPPSADLPSPLLASACPTIAPFLSSVCVFLSPCPPNCPLDFLFVYLLACLPVAWQSAKTILQSVPITPWETTSNIVFHIAARSQLLTHTHRNVCLRNYLL